MGVEPTWTGLQPVAVPSGSSVFAKPKVESGKRKAGEGFTEPLRFRLSAIRSVECPSQESNLAYELRGLACDPAHSKDMLPVPCRGVEPRLAVSKTAVRPSHSQGIYSEHPDLESNQVRAPTAGWSLRKLACYPAHSRAVFMASRSGVEPEPRP